MFLNPNPGPDGKKRPSSPDLPPLSPEIAQWFEARQRRVKPVLTTKTPSGQTLDWIAIESQVPGGKIATPPPPYSIGTDDKVRPVQFELDDPKIERGPKGTVPVLRKNLAALHATTSLKQYLSKRGGLLVNEKRPKGPADPDSFGFFHGTSGQSINASGCSTWLNVWDPYVETSEDHSIMQCGLQNYDRPLRQSLEAGWTVDYSLNGDWLPHLFTYYTTNGYTDDDDNVGGYNSDVDGWVQISSSICPGIGLSGYSSEGGVQYGFSIRYYLDDNDLNWWLGVQGQWIGYYPAWLFFGAPGESLFSTLGAVAEWVGFWGEVYSVLPDPNQTTTQMGSGRKAEAGWTHACFQKNLLIQPAGSQKLINQNGSTSAEDPTLFDIKAHMNSGGPWGSYFYAGGS